MTKKDIYQAVTDRILEALDRGVVPWRKPWTSRNSMPVSLSTGKPYRGVNTILLAMAGYSEPRWGTYKAMKEAAVEAARKDGREVILKTNGKRSWYVEIIDGREVSFAGGVRKGEKGTEIILWKPVKKQVENADSGETEETKYLLLRSFHVFNAEQCDGLPEFDREERPEHEQNERAEMVWAGYKTRPALLHGQTGAYYAPLKDMVGMPDPEDFVGPAEYYQTLFHELVHSTGHESRLDRLEPAIFGSDPYAKEELVAEIGASMLAGLAGLETAGGEQSAAYVQSWAKRFREDPKLIVNAAAQAQKAADRILGDTFAEQAEFEPIAVAA
jgi:antirestriction protein ArdC